MLPISGESGSMLSEKNESERSSERMVFFIGFLQLRANVCCDNIGIKERGIQEDKYAVRLL